MPMIPGLVGYHEQNFIHEHNYLPQVAFLCVCI